MLSLLLLFLLEEPKGEAKWNVEDPGLPGRRLELSFSEGTWMNLDVSPDGRHLVFDLLGDIYLLPIEGGEARALTQGLAWDMQPRFSPDGASILFCSDRSGGDNLWLMNADGTNPTALTSETFRLLNSPCFSPDGKLVAARKHFTASRSLGAGEIWFYHREGGKGFQVVEKLNDQKDLGEPAFSPDGHYLYYSQDASPGEIFEYNKDPHGGIYRIRRRDLRSGEELTLLAGPGGAIRPTPSPDGRHLAYIRRVGYETCLFLYDLESGRQKLLSNQLDRDLQETWAIHGVYPQMAWHPDSRSLFFWAAGGIQRLDLATLASKNVPFQAKNQHHFLDALRFPVSVAPDSFQVKALRWVTHAPAGNSVAFQALGRIFRKEGDKAAVALTEPSAGLAFFPTFSRDGGQLAYVSWSDKGGGAIHLIDLKSGKQRVVSKRAGAFVEPAFSPDGRYLAYRRAELGGLFALRDSQQPGIYLLDLGNGQERRLVGEGVRPQFGADSERVFFTTYGKNQAQTFSSIHLEGRERREHAKGEMATEISVDPSGSRLAFCEDGKMYLVPFLPGGKIQTLSAASTEFPLLALGDGGGLHWSMQGKRLHGSLASTLFTYDLQAAEPAKSVQSISLSFEQPSDRPSGLLALTGARIVTMAGDEVLEKGTLLLEGNRITAVGPAAQLAIPPGAKIIDLSGKTIIPGLIDVHAHGPYGSNQLMPQQNWSALAALAFGVTTLHDPSNDTALVFAASELARAGVLLAPRLFSTGTILYGATMPGYTAKIESLEDAKRHLARLQAWGAFSVKSYNQPRRDQRQKVLAAARELGMMVVPEGGSLFQHNMSMVADGHTGIEHAIPLARLYGDVQSFWGATAVQYTPTLVVAYGGIWGENYWYAHDEVFADPLLTRFVPPYELDPVARRPFKAPLEEYNHIQVARSAKALGDHGVRINLGAHGQREGLAAHWELWMMQQGGMTALECLRAGTLNGAHYLGLDGELGSLQPGKLADLVVLDGNPLEDLHLSRAIHAVMLNGRLFDAELNQIHPLAERRPALFWQEEGGRWPLRGTAQSGSEAACCASGLCGGPTRQLE